MSSYTGREFVKMSGSGNDFVMVDARAKARGELGDPKVITRICAHGTGIGADGVVLLERSDRADVKLTYFNSDGSLADLCGNATLCTTRLAVRLGAAKADGLTIETGAGIIAARVLESGDPEIDLAEVQEVRPEAAGIPIEGTEVRMGFVRPGIPHLVIEVPDLSQVDVTGRGRPLRFHPSLRDGANVNFIARDGAGWAIRTYERGVEGETLACGTGAVGSAIMVATWTGSTDPVSLRTRSGRTLRVRLRKTETGWLPSLSGEARFVFDGRFGEV